jgi:hypothetical protein
MRLFLAGDGYAADKLYMIVFDIQHPGEAVQVDPTQITLKAPGTKRLKLN